MLVYGFKAKQLIEKREESVLGMVTKKYTSYVWLIVNGDYIGQWVINFDMDCLSGDRDILKEMLAYATASKGDGTIIDYHIVEFKIGEGKVLDKIPQL